MIVTNYHNHLILWPVEKNSHKKAGTKKGRQMSCLLLNARPMSNGYLFLQNTELR